MKVVSIELYQIDLTYAGGTYRLSGGREYSRFDASIVRVVSDSDIDGWGESTPFGSTFIAPHALGVRAGIKEIAPHLLGRNPRQVDRINEAMDSALLGHNHAKCALDVACWDLFGGATTQTPAAHFIDLPRFSRRYVQARRGTQSAGIQGTLNQSWYNPGSGLQRSALWAGAIADAGPLSHPEGDF